MDSSRKSEIFCNNPGLDSLKNFTIPRRKRRVGNAYLEICHTDWREHSFIQSTLNGSKLDSSYSLNSFWKFGDVKLIHNEKLEQQFAEKRSKMREDGRRAKELEEHIFFLVTSRGTALNVYQEGLKVSSSIMKALGDPAHGVYLYRHIDVLLKYHRLKNQIAETILFFKVLLGKVKAIPPCIVKSPNAVVDPTAKFDCHTSQNPADLKEPIDIQIVNSAVYLYEFNSSCEAMEKPRQCLPYALVTVRFTGNEVKATAFPLWFSSAARTHVLPAVKVIETGNLKNCTLAQRLGKGKNAKVVFQHFGKIEIASVSPVQCSASSSLGSLVTSNIKLNQDPRLLKRHVSNANGKGCSVLNQASQPSESILVDPALKSCQLINVHTLTSGEQLLVNESGCCGHAENVEEQMQSQYFENQTSEHEEFDPFGVSTPRAAATCSEFFSSAVVSQASDVCKRSTTQKDEYLANFISQRDQDPKLGSGEQTNGLSFDLTGSKISDEPYFEELKLYESELKEKLRKYSVFLVLPEKERIAKIESLENLSRIDKKAFFYRLKKYDRHYEKYENQLSLNKCHNIVVSKLCTSISLYNSDMSARQDVKPSSSPLTCTSSSLNSGDTVTCSFSGFRETTEQQPKQRKPSLVLGKGVSDISESNSPTCTATVKSRLSEVFPTNGVRVPSEKETPLGGLSEVRRADSPETDKKEDKMNQVQSSWDNDGTNRADGASVIFESHLQLASPSVTSSIHTEKADEPVELYFPTVNDLFDGRVDNTDILHQGEMIPMIGNPGGSNKNEVKSGEMQRNGNAPITEDDVVCVCHSEEVETSTLSSKHTAHTYGESQSCDSLLHTLAARIEWQQFFEKSNVSELKTILELSRATKPVAFDQQISPPAETAATDVKLLHGSDFLLSTDGEGKYDPRSPRLTDEKLSAPDNRDAIPDLQITLNDLSSEYDRYLQHPVPCVGTERCWDQPCVDVRAFIETKADKCLEISSKEYEVALDGGTSKATSKTETPGLKDALLMNNQILPKLVRKSKEHDVCGLKMSKNYLDHRLNNDLSYCSDPELFKNCKQNSIYSSDLYVVGPQNKLSESCEDNNIPQSPNDHSCRMTIQDVEHLAAGNVKPNVKNIVPDSAGENFVKGNLSEKTLERVNKSHDTVTGDARIEDEGNDTVLLDSNSSASNESLCYTVQREERKDFSTTLRLQVEDVKCPKYDSMNQLPKERNVLTGESNITSDYDFSLTLECGDNEPHINDVIATGKSGTVYRDIPFRSSIEQNSEPKLNDTSSENLFSFKPIEQTDSVPKKVGKVSVEPKETLFPALKFKAPDKYRHQNNKPLNLVHSRSPSLNLPHVEIHSTQDIKKKSLKSKQSTDDFISLYEGRSRAFNTSKKQITQLTSVLSTEASLSKSRRLYKLLTKAVIHLNKACKKVCESSEIVTKTGITRNQISLPKSYQSNCNSFWETCDMNSHQFLKRQRCVSNPKWYPNYSQSNDPKQVKGLAVSTEKGKRLLKNAQSACFKSKNDPCSTKNNDMSRKTAGVELTYVGNKPAMSTNSEKLRRTVKHQRNHPKFKMRENGRQIMPSNPGLVQEPKSCEATFTINGFNQSELNLLKFLTKSTLLESQVECHLTKPEIMGPKVGSTILDFPSKSTFMESLIRMQIYSQEDKLCAEKGTNAKAILDLKKMQFPIETCMLKSQCEVKAAKVPVEFKIVQCNSDHTDLKSVDFQHADLSVKSRTTEPLADSLIKSNSVKDAVGSCSVKFQTAECKLSPVENLCIEINTKVKKPSLCHKLESSSIESVAVGFVDLCQKVKTHIGSQSVKSQLEYQVLQSHLHFKAADLQAESQNFQSQCELNTTELPVVKSQIEFQRTNCKSNPKDNTGAFMPSQTEEVLIDSQKMQMKISNFHEKETYTEPRSVLFNEKPFQRKPQDPKLRSESMTQEYDKMQREEGKIISDNETESEYLRARNTFVERKAGQNNLKQGDTKTTSGNKFPSKPMKERQLHVSLVVQASEILREADTSPLLDKLEELKLTCEKMLPVFISAFERSQGESFTEVFISRDLLLQNNLQNPTHIVHLKSNALDSFVELQIMMETVQFLENKISFLKGLPTFRSLLWYDEILYSELLVGKRGSQQQSSFYPSFQERVQSKCLDTVHDYRAQVLKSFQMEMKGQNAYYVYLKHRRELEESSAVMQHIADCCNFWLSIPLTTGIHFGGNVEALETLRKDVWTLVNKYTSLPEEQRDVGKLVHLWIIIDIVNAKIRTIHGCLLTNNKLLWFGMEHIQFNAAKMLVWQKKRKMFDTSNSGVSELRSIDQRSKLKELIVELNRDAMCMLYTLTAASIGNALQKGPSLGNKFLDANTSVKLPNGDLTEQQIPKSLEGDLDQTSKPFTSVGIILERSRAARQEELEQLLQICERQSESLKRCFQVLQHVDVEKVLVTEAIILDLCASHNASPVLLNLEAVEIYIELIMMYETIHYLRNLIAQQLNHPTYRGMLWFDSTLFPELLQSQQDISIFSLFRKKCLNNSCAMLEHAISTLQQKLDLILEYRQSANYTYAVQLLLRECSELIAIRTYMKRHKLCVKMYVNAPPYAASINYGCTESELTHNYRQFGMVLEKLVKAPEKDLGKMAHVIEVMKSIMNMKQVAAEDSASVIHLLTYQLQQNSKKRQLLANAENLQGCLLKVENDIDCGRKEHLSLPSDMTHVSRTSKGPDLQLCVTRKRQFCEVPPGFHQRKHEVDVPPMPKRRMCKDLPLQDEEIKVGDNIEIKLSSKNIQNRKELQSTSQSMEPMALTTPKSCVNTRYLTHKISRFSSSEVQRNSEIPLTPQIPALPKYTSEESTVSPLISDSPKIACANMRTHSCSGSQLTHFLTVTHNCQSKQIIYPIKHKSPSLRSCNPSQSVLYEETAFDSFESKGQTIDTYGRIRKQQLELPQGAENNLTEQKMKRNNSSCRQHQKIHNPCEILSSHLIDTPIKSNIFPVQPSLSSQAHTSFDSPLCEQFDVSIHSSTVRSADNPQNLHLQPTIHESSIFPILHSGTSSPDGIISSEITSIGSAPTASSTSKEHECADVSKNPLLQSKTQVTRDSSKIASNIEQLSSVSLQTTNKPAITDGMMRPHSPIQIRIPVQFIGFGTNSHLTSHSLIKPSFRTQKKSRWDCCQ